MNRNASDWPLHLQAQQKRAWLVITLNADKTDIWCNMSKSPVNVMPQSTLFIHVDLDPAKLCRVFKFICPLILNLWILPSWILKCHFCWLWWCFLPQALISDCPGRQGYSNLKPVLLQINICKQRQHAELEEITWLIDLGPKLLCFMLSVRFCEVGYESRTPELKQESLSSSDQHCSKTHYV